MFVNGVELVEKKTFTMVLRISILIIVCSAFLYNHQNKMKLGLESVVGSSLFMIWSNYNSILTNQTQKLSLEKISDINQKLYAIEAYSHIVDQVVGYDLLRPIAKNMIVINESMKKSFEKNKTFTEDDQRKYSKLIAESNALIPLIYKTYYVPESIEGAEVSLKLNEYKGLVELNNRLSKYTTSLSK